MTDPKGYFDAIAMRYESVLCALLGEAPDALRRMSEAEITKRCREMPQVEEFSPELLAQVAKFVADTKFASIQTEQHPIRWTKAGKEWLAKVDRMRHERLRTGNWAANTRHLERKIQSQRAEINRLTKKKDLLTSTDFGNCAYPSDLFCTPAERRVVEAAMVWDETPLAGVVTLIRACKALHAERERNTAGCAPEVQSSAKPSLRLGDTDAADVGEAPTPATSPAGSAPAAETTWHPYGFCTHCNWRSQDCETNQEARAMSALHDMMCPKHPMRALEREVSDLRGKVAEAEKRLAGAGSHWTIFNGHHVDDWDALLKWIEARSAPLPNERPELVAMVERAAHSYVRSTMKASAPVDREVLAKAILLAVRRSEGSPRTWENSSAQARRESLVAADTAIAHLGARAGSGGVTEAMRAVIGRGPREGMISEWSREYPMRARFGYDSENAAYCAESSIGVARDELKALDSGTHVLVEKGEMERLRGLDQWACSSCGCRFGRVRKPLDLEGVTRCSKCVEAEIFAAKLTAAERERDAAVHDRDTFKLSWREAEGKMEAMRGAYIQSGREVVGESRSEGAAQMPKHNVASSDSPRVAVEGMSDEIIGTDVVGAWIAAEGDPQFRLACAGHRARELCARKITLPPISYLKCACMPYSFAYYDVTAIQSTARLSGAQGERA